MKIEGSGPVDGDTTTMSSSRGELQGQTALAIISECFLKKHGATDIPITLFSDNQGVQQCCSTTKIQRIGHHRKANMDLQLEHNKRSRDLNISHKWVKGQQDGDKPWETIEELIDMNLTPDATLNIYCDQKAVEEQHKSITEPNSEVLPAEKWALFSRVPFNRKITGKLTEGVLQTLHRDNLVTYISKKHKLTEEKLHQIDSSGLGTYLKSLRPHNRASTIKLIHRWIPTNEFLFKQHRCTSPLCPRCLQHNETAQHILTCPDKLARKQRQQHLYTLLEKLEEGNTSPHILSCMETHFSDCLQTSSLNKYSLVTNQSEQLTPYINDAVRHQNIIGWENLLRGYISSYWLKAQSAFPSTNSSTSKRAQRTIEQVKAIYSENPTLAPRYTAVKAVSLDMRLRRTTKNMQEWIARIEHQKMITSYIAATISASQMTIREAFRRVKEKQGIINKYPP
jgi:hypothetical protein